MATDLNLDGHVEAVESAPDAGRWHDALVNLLNAGLRSDRTPFNAAAKETAAVVDIPTGLIQKWSGSADSVPDGWLPCNGQAVSKTDHAALFAKIGHAFGGSGATFNLPDYRRRVSVGAGGARPAGSLGPGVDLGDTGGHETASLTVGQMARHQHGLDLSLASAGAHTHQVYETWRADANDSLNTTRRLSAQLSGAAATLDSAGAHAHAITGDTAEAGQATPTPVALASKTVVMTHIIKT